MSANGETFADPVIRRAGAAARLRGDGRIIAVGEV